MGIEPGQIVDGKYRVTACIGQGGMGAVFAGEHLKLHRKVAIKVLHAEVAGDLEVVARFEREAQAAGRIGNDHILEVLDIGVFPGGDHYIVMEFLEGEPLNGRLSRLGRVSPREIYPLARQMLEGLAAAHAAGIVHRDLKPANVFVLREKAGRPDYVKLIDFGISKFQTLAGDTNHHQTRTGTIIGTPSYMSPEQARGLREADARSDIYAIGVILYEAVTGTVPFTGESTNDLLFKIYLNEPPPIETLVHDVDAAFSSLIMKALAKDPAHRFATAGEFIAALDAWMQAGRGVEVAKAPAMAATVIERSPGSSQPARSSGSRAPATQGAWTDARSGGVDPGVTRSRKVAVFVAATVVTLVGLGGVLALVIRNHRAAPALEAPTAAPASSVPAAPTVVKLPEPVDEPPPSARHGSRDLAPFADAGGTAAVPASLPSAAPPEEPVRHERGHSPRPPASNPRSPAPRGTSDPLDQL